MNYFYYPALFDVYETITLPEEESHHALRVLRLTIGDTIVLINGLGQKAEGKILFQEGKKIKVQFYKIENQEPPRYKITIALAQLKKRERMEWFVEKAVELGASEIIVFISEHTEKKKADLIRLHKIAISALKQSGNLWMPYIKTDNAFEQLVNEPFDGIKFIAHCEEGIKSLLKDAYQAKENVLILIGPEGDFSSKEIDLALKNNFIPVSLGDLRLRAETAALTALITLKVLSE